MSPTRAGCGSEGVDVLTYRVWLLLNFCGWQALVPTVAWVLPRVDSTVCRGLSYCTTVVVRVLALLAVVVSFIYIFIFGHNC